MFFRGDFFFLSNFYPVEIKFDGVQYHSAENAYQAQKTSLTEEQLKIARMSPGKAKRYTRSLPMEAGWDLAKVSLMKAIVGQKFKENKELAAKLLQTGTRELVEDNYWHDSFWGRCRCDRCRGLVCENHMGKVLMDVRDELRRRA